MVKINPQKIGIFRALNLGDILCSIPAVRALRSAYPEPQITLIGLPWAKKLTSRFNKYFDRFWRFPGYPGLPEQRFKPEEFTRFLKKVQSEEFDLILQMHGSGVLTNPLISLFNGKIISGFYKKGEFKPNNKFFWPYPEEKHEVVKWINLMNNLGVEAKGFNLEFPISNKEHESLANKLKNYEMDLQNYVCIHPGARDFKKCWSVEKFAQTADALNRLGHTVVVTGSEKEKERVEKMISNMKSDALNMAGKTKLGELGSLIKNSRLVICNDTGISHIASALKVPSVVIFSKHSRLKRWAPLDKDKHTALTPEKVDDPKNVIKAATKQMGAGSSTSKKVYFYAKS